MNGNIILALPVFFPILAAVITYFPGRGRPSFRSAAVILITAAELALTVFCLMKAMGSSFSIAECWLFFELDGFRAIYAAVVAFMWFITAFFSPEYFSHYHNRSRYYFFFLMTLGATQGVFLSADLRSTLLFFEIMSLTSYAWVAHDESPAAMKAAGTYLGIAIIGGLAALMGLFLLNNALGTLHISELYAAGAALESKAVLYTASACLLLGFGAKAGMFPLHIWLPKAHPVAPAPASALLSGVLTKTGVFGILVIACDILRHDHVWGMLMLALGTVTMVLGALMALFSIDLKRTLACSSMSQIGFVLVGVAMLCLLGEENALAARGTLLHMVNHSLIKLDLFIIAGVVYMNTHRLDLNTIRGWGKGKPLLHAAFLSGALGIGGIPGFNGYISKTLLHEAIVEYAHHSHLAVISVVEWLFIISGGITLSYMLKLYICIFHEGEKPQKANYLSPLSALSLCAAALLPLLLGILPYTVQDKLADLGTVFMHAASPAHAVHYFSWINLKGAVFSVAVALFVYPVIVRCLLMKKSDGRKLYINAIPEGFDLEDGFYRPLLLRWLPALFGSLAGLFGENKLLAPICKAALTGLKTAAAFICGIPDGIVYLLRRTLYKNSPLPQEHKHIAFLHGLGALLDSVRQRLRLPQRQRESYAELLTDAAVTITQTTRGIAGNFSFALLMACIGICAALVYLLFI